MTAGPGAAIDRIAGCIARWFAYGAGAILFALVGLTMFKLVADLAGGWLGDGAATSLVSGYEELVRNFIALAAFAMLPYCQHRHGHVAVDFFVDRAPRWLQGGLAAASLLLFLGVAGMTFTFMAIYLPELREGNFTTGQILGWPAWPFYLPALAALAAWMLVLVTELAALRRRAPRRRHERAGDG